MTRRRTLSPEDRALWDRIARTTEPLHPARKPAVHDPKPLPPVQPKPKPPAPKVAHFRVGETSKPDRDHDLMGSILDQVGASPIHMDRKTHGRMTRGKLAPESRLDLHGMTLAEAHPELINFVLTSHARGLRLILVITGKGKDRDTPGPIPTRFGVLRHQVPHWLRMAPLGPLVLQVSQAAQKHGGHGAYYVYLRRRR